MAVENDRSEVVSFDAAFNQVVGTPEGRARVADARRRIQLLLTIRRYREATGLTQAAVAAQMGVGQSTISELESAETDPRLSTLQRYARSVGGSLELRFVMTSGVAQVTSASTSIAPRPCPQYTHGDWQLPLGARREANAR